MFCKACGAMLKPMEKDGKRVLGCSCGFFDKDARAGSITFSKPDEHKAKKEEIEIIEKEIDLRDIVDEECPKCGNTKAYHWTQQVGPSDEPEDNLFRCTKCGQGWREKY